MILILRSILFFFCVLLPFLVDSQSLESNSIEVKILVKRGEGSLVREKSDHGPNSPNRLQPEARENPKRGKALLADLLPYNGEKPSAPHMHQNSPNRSPPRSPRRVSNEVKHDKGKQAVSSHYSQTSSPTKRKPKSPPLSSKVNLTPLEIPQIQKMKPGSSPNRHKPSQWINRKYERKRDSFHLSDYHRAHGRDPRGYQSDDQLQALGETTADMTLMNQGYNPFRPGMEAILGPMGTPPREQPGWKGSSCFNCPSPTSPPCKCPSPPSMPNLNCFENCKCNCNCPDCPDFDSD